MIRTNWNKKQKKKFFFDVELWEEEEKNIFDFFLRRLHQFN